MVLLLALVAAPEVTIVADDELTLAVTRELELRLPDAIIGDADGAHQVIVGPVAGEPPAHTVVVRAPDSRVLLEHTIAAQATRPLAREIAVLVEGALRSETSSLSAELDLMLREQNDLWVGLSGGVILHSESSLQPRLSVAGHVSVWDWLGVRAAMTSSWPRREQGSVAEMSLFETTLDLGPEAVVSLGDVDVGLAAGLSLHWLLARAEAMEDSGNISIWRGAAWARASFIVPVSRAWALELSLTWDGLEERPVFAWMGEAVLRRGLSRWAVEIGFRHGWKMF